MYLPNLLVIGAMKAGSTSLHDYLNLHPEIFMSEVKEIDYFIKEKNYSKGLDWYKSNFPVKSRYRGESSINYSKKHNLAGVPERILRDLGKNIKLIYIVRDPVDRFQSNFTDSKTYGDIPSSYSINQFIEEGIEDNPFVKTSSYYFQIKDYLALFDKENFYFLKAEDLKSNPQKEMDKLYQFLGLNSIPVKEIKRNQSVKKAYYNTAFVAFNENYFVNKIKAVFPKPLLYYIKEHKAVQGIIKKEFNPALDVISEENRAKLYAYLEEDLRLFKEVSGISFSKK